MKYLYTPFDIAYYLIVENFTISKEQKIINTLWQESNSAISSLFRNDKKHFAKSIRKEIHKFDNLQWEYMDELNLIFQEMGSHFRIGESDFEQGVIESYFKLIKLRLTYSPDTKYCNVK